LALILWRLLTIGRDSVVVYSLHSQSGGSLYILPYWVRLPAADYTLGSHHQACYPFGELVPVATGVNVSAPLKRAALIERRPNKCAPRTILLTSEFRLYQETRRGVHPPKGNESELPPVMSFPPPSLPSIPYRPIFPSLSKKLTWEIRSPSYFSMNHLDSWLLWSGRPWKHAHAYSKIQTLCIFIHQN